jgi:hypothetical protein
VAGLGLDLHTRITPQARGRFLLVGSDDLSLSLSSVLDKVFRG